MTARLGLVRRFAKFSNEYPWRWQPAEVEAFFSVMRCGVEPLAVSTARSHQNALRMFCDYILDAHYGWVTECLDRFGVAPVQILHEWNTITQVSEFEADLRRRPLTYDDVQDLFECAPTSNFSMRRTRRFADVRAATCSAGSTAMPRRLTQCRPGPRKIASTPCCVWSRHPWGRREDDSCGSTLA